VSVDTVDSRRKQRRSAQRNCLEATRRIRTGRSGARDPGIPIIAMTGDAMQEDRDRCVVAGMNDYLTKPVQINVFTRVLD
jgi:CheY-like chemotaxis protein